jgi:hypothetical protein
MSSEPGVGWRAVRVAGTKARAARRQDPYVGTWLRLRSGDDSLLSDPEFGNTTDSNGLRVPVGRLELPTYRPKPTPAGAEKLWAAALKSKQLLAAVCLRQLYFETGRWRCDFLVNQMTAMGRSSRL